MSDFKLIIIGDGPMLDMATATAERTWPLGQIIVERLAPQDIASNALLCLDNMEPATTEVFAAIGVHALNYARFDLWAKLRLRGFRAATIVDPSASVAISSRLAENCLVGPCASVGPNTTVGIGTVVAAGAQIAGGGSAEKFVWIGANSTLGAGASVGQHCVIASGVHIGPGVEVGEHCELSQSGSFVKAVADGTFVSASFSQPVRLYRAQVMRSALQSLKN